MSHNINQRQQAAEKRRNARMQRQEFRRKMKAETQL